MAKRDKGKVVQVIGTVVDVGFDQNQLPEIFHALELENEGERLVLEVEQHVGNSWARCLALGPTEGLARGVEVVDTGAPVSVPVGKDSLGNSLPKTILKGSVGHGTGGCCWTFDTRPNVQHGIKTTNDSSVVKKAVLNNKNTIVKIFLNLYFIYFVLYLYII